MKELNKSDIVLDDNIRLADSVKEGAYPDGLEENQVVRLIYFFGSRKLREKAKIASQTPLEEQLSKLERKFLDEAFKWFGFKYSTPLEFKAAYNALTIKFKTLLTFLKKRPAFITRSIYNALKVAGYKNVITNVVFVVDKYGNVVPRLASPSQVKEQIPLGKIETMLWDIQGITLDKMLLILQSISPKDIKKANLGIKSKAVRDLFAMFHMSRLNSKNPNLTLINLSVHTASPDEKIKIYSQYINKNREMN